MENNDRGPMMTFEISWKSGHVERIQAHQVTFPGSVDFEAMFAVGTKTRRDPRVVFHGEVNGRWTLILSALEDDIRTVRNVLTEDGDGMFWVSGLGEVES